MFSDEKDTLKSIVIDSGYTESKGQEDFAPANGYTVSAGEKGDEKIYAIS